MAENTQRVARQPLWSMAAAEMLLDRVAQGVLIVSWDGKVTYANHTVGALLHTQRTSLLGAGFVELAPERERPALQTALGAGREALSQHRLGLRKSGGGEFPVLMTFAPLAHGQASCLVTDLSEQKRREESTERLRRFLGTLAQELRDLLSPMQIALSVLKTVHTADDEAGRAAVSAQRQADRMLGLIEDLRKINGRY